MLRVRENFLIFVSSSAFPHKKLSVFDKNNDLYVVVINSP